jgi:hypothetical protein
MQGMGIFLKPRHSLVGPGFHGFEPWTEAQVSYPFRALRGGRCQPRPYSFYSADLQVSTYRPEGRRNIAPRRRSCRPTELLDD